MGLLIHTVAKEANISVDTVRRLEKLGVISSKRDFNGWRRFSPDVIGKLKNLYASSDDQSEAGARAERPLRTGEIG